ncbi:MULTISPECIES: response regulator [Desulfatibacillum]|jgi:DNA-binding NtrC family response regulator|uniref:Response regulator receiver domain protein (CheY-like) n=2 Tax=Desulfatibacillum TaxID=218207 RepID=B8FIF8_DESAL|nr:MULTISPECIES: response regulator [Desulfatibacillum]ACL03948.1 Response regulator receiver domain protein (CheY-like) [Desulfatibacillum aliphaticivorans]SHL05929.1 Response regulator receiver domain-containing protein [Desulfatibacillum alkenivorans DSM 16219]
MVRVPINILVVDDEEDFVEMFSLRLEEMGEIVKGVNSGQECLDVLESTDVDVVILDIKMPGMDGIETLREIKRRRPITEVILLTGHGTTDTAVEGMKLGAFDYLNKPADFKDLMEKLEGARKRKAEQEERIRKAESRSLMRRSGNLF